MTDEDDVKNWDRFETTFAETGQTTKLVQTFDDGRLQVTDYENGLRTQSRVEDTGAVHSWSSLVTTFDENGVRSLYTQTFDDGRVAVTGFTDGLRSERVVTDIENAKNRGTITTGYTDAGKPDLMVIAYDDQRTSTTTYENGLRKSVEIAFPDDGSDVQSITTTYAVNGARLDTTRVLNGGDVQVTELVSLAVAVNIGGAAFTAANGLVYEADTFAAGNTFGTSAQMKGTENSGLYQGQTWKPGVHAFEIAVENGDYLLELNFAETFSGAANSGQRGFDIFVEDELVFNDFDIAEEAGFETAIDLLGKVKVEDGILNLEMVGVVDNASIAGFSIWSADGSGRNDFVIGSVADEFVFG